jgi:GNAT superfamily N-acetyltransferase
MPTPTDRPRLRRVRQILRYEGQLALLWRTATRAVAPVARVGVSTIYQAHLTTRAPARPRLHVERVERPIEELVTLAAQRNTGEARPSTAALAAARRTILQRLEHGQWCFVARVGEAVVHHGWFAFDWVQWPGQDWCATDVPPHRCVRLGADEAFHSDAYTAEAWRGHGIYTAALTAMLEQLREAGFRRVCAEVEVQNTSSSKTHRRLGWQTLGTVLHCVPRGSARAWRRPVGGRDPFVTLPDSTLRFRAMGEVPAPVMA